MPSTPASSSSTSRALTLGEELRVVADSWRAKTVERFRTGGIAGYVLLLMLRPVFDLSVAALIYGGTRPDLVRYTVVTIAAQSLVFSTIFYIGEILDRERINGTLVALFQAPAARTSWLSGFALVGLSETALVAAAILLFGRFGLGVHFDPNLPALIVTLALFIASLWGLGFVFSAVGLVLQKANPMSNVIYPFTVLLGGVYYPVDQLPDWLRYPARLLPLGYGMQALADAALDNASLGDLIPQLLPLVGFAVALPLVGALTFRWLERLVRERGELDLY